MLTQSTDSKIDLLDSADTVAKKIKKAQAAPQVVEDNGMLAFVEYVLLPASGLKTGKREFVVDRERDGLEPLVYNDIAKMHEDYRNDVVCAKETNTYQRRTELLTHVFYQLKPQQIKPAVAKGINELLGPIQAAYQASQDWQEVALKAYPPPPAPAKKVKKVKDKGSRHPVKGAQAANGTPDDHVEQVTEDAAKVNLTGEAK